MVNTLPSEGSIVYRHQERKTTFTKFERRLNRFFIFLYRIYLLPLFGLGRVMILIQTIGRKTGKRRIKPVLCRRFYTDKLTLYSPRGMKADWLKNILETENHIFTIQKGFRKFDVKATLIQDEAAKLQHLEYWFNNFRDAKNIFGYDHKKHQGIIGTEEFINLAKLIEFIQLDIV
jgi:hypothetical protein